MSTFDHKSLSDTGLIAPLRQIIYEYTNPNILYRVDLHVDVPFDIELDLSLGTFSSLDDAIIRALSTVNVDIESPDNTWDEQTRNRYDRLTKQWTLVNPDRFRSEEKRYDHIHILSIDAFRLDPEQGTNGSYVHYHFDDGLFEISLSTESLGNFDLDHIESYIAWKHTIGQLLNDFVPHSCADNGHILSFDCHDYCLICDQPQPHADDLFHRKINEPNLPVTRIDGNAIALKAGLFGCTWNDLTRVDALYLARWTEQQFDLLSKIETGK